MCFSQRIFPFWFRAEASSRGFRVKNDVPIRLSVKMSQPRGTPSWLWGRQASCLPANRSLEASDATKSQRSSGSSATKEYIMRINARCYL
ncbi:MAG: hypothetical protein DMF17_12445 [Verrucomicrobia bacterium]|nr:MAG: hypothetical protein DMF17_12445 [Verrucomicrobiota bacterium]